MFLENTNRENNSAGWIEVICGSMFSGKTEELIRRLNRAKIAKQKVEIFKPMVDTRYSEDEIVSHNKTAIRSTSVETASQILLYIDDIDVVGIDEAQFFDKELANVCNELADRGVRVIVAGLDVDFKRNPFGTMPEILSIAEYVTKVHAICMDCGKLAQYSYRTADNENLVLLGETDSYIPLCRTCYNCRNRGE